jgi:antitoxin component YwqK of YwqJK toxin-antitoxin module
MNTIDHAHLVFDEDGIALLDGSPFTGTAVRAGEEEVRSQVYVDGFMEGPSATWDGNGQLVALGCVYGGGMRVGAFHRWDPTGALVLEEVDDVAGNRRLTRAWDPAGRLTREERHERLFASADPETGRKVDLAWQKLRVSARMAQPRNQEFLIVPDLEDLTVVEAPGTERRVLFEGAPYTGEAVTDDGRGGVQMHTFVEGVEDGFTLVWSPGGKLVLQGITRRPHGPVGPWHHWDEQGRLLRETVHDALGNRVIVRELDETGDIVREEHRPPTRLARHPGTDEELPALWL